MSAVIAPPAPAPAAGARPAASRPWWRRSWVIGACFAVVAGVAVMAVLGSLIAPQNPNTQNLGSVLAGPDGAHWLGTDSLGRDVFSRLIAGSRTAVAGPLVIAAGSLLIGNLLGLWAGYRGGLADAVVMRWVDLMWSVPGLLVIIVVAGATGGGYWLAVGLLLVLTVPFDTRVVRAATLEQVPRPYVEAARVLGVSDRRIMIFHVWPNVSPVAVANAFLNFAGSIGFVSALSFLGLGVAPGTPDWGLMLAEGETALFANPVAVLAPDWGLMLAEGEQDLFANPVAVLAPAALIVLTATAANLIGDWLHEQLAGRGATR